MSLMARTQHELLFEDALQSSAPTLALRDAVAALIDGGIPPNEVLAELETFRAKLRRKGRESEEDAVLEVMDFVVGWSSPHVSLRKPVASRNSSPVDGSRSHPGRSAAIPTPEIRTVFPGTSGGVWSDRRQAALQRDLYFPPTPVAQWTIAILDLTGILPTASVLQDFVLPLGQRIRGGVYGPLTLVVRTADAGVADFLSYLAKEHSLPIYVFRTLDRAPSVEPAGSLTSTEHTTLNILFRLGGTVTAPQLANEIGIEHTAAGNRLSILASKGYVIRVSQPPRYPDFFIEPRSFLVADGGR